MPNLADVCRIGPDFEHSPTPWHTGNAYKCAKGHAIASGPTIIARVSGNGYPIGLGWAPTSQADADFIVRAVNAHDHLLAACKRALPWIGKMIADNAHLNSVAPNDCVGAMQQLDAAIAKAEGR